MPRTCTTISLLAAALLLGGVSAPGVAAEAEPASFAKSVQPLLASHCIRCHGPEKQKGGVDLAIFQDEKAVLKQAKLWKRVLKQLESRAMPPEGAKALTEEERRQLLDGIKLALNSGDASQRDPGPALVRRLNRSEYNRTLRDLLGVEFDFAGAVGIPPDPAGASFDNLAVALDIPPILLEKYFAAADLALERLYAGATRNPKDNARKSYDAVLFALPGKGFSEPEAARKIVERFAGRAYRRPIEPAEVDRLAKLFERARGKGESFEGSIRVVLKTVLVSPYFLFRIEQDRGAKGQPSRIGAHELAVRLSYFLWSSMPDAELLALADQGQLADAATLEKQVRRMLADPRARALTDNFAGQWLQLRKLDEARPSQDFFPTFTTKVRQAMHDEVATFFDKLRQEDRSVLELLDADYTYVNQELAKHYGLPEVQGQEMRRVALRPEDRRGGLLGMGAMLALTSHTSRTSPTLRGKYILEVMLGDPPPPPPPDAGQIEEKQKGKEPKSFRELLAQHSSQARCASCHTKIDPLGFGLENFDPVGRWRESANGKPVDATGTLPGGDRFAGPAELKQILMKRKGDFTRNFTEQLLTYALGRELEYYDDVTVREVAAELERNQHRFSSLILGIVRSYPLQYRKAAE